MRFVSLIVVLIPALVGCAKTAVVKAWVPATIDVSGMNQIAVLSFQGDNGPAIASSLNSQFWANGFYDVVDATGLDTKILQAGYDPSLPSNPRDVLAPAREAGLDGVILGQVLEYRCDDERFDSNHVHFGRDESYSRFGSSFSSGIGFESNSVLVRDGSVSIAFRLVDVRTGEIRAAKTVTHHFHGQVVNGHGSIPSEGEVLDKLTEKCLDDIVSMVAPHQRECTMRLATSEYWCRGRSLVNEGVKLAQQGKWDEADRAWEQALELNPKNHAALYNRAVAAASRQDYEVAEDLAMSAIKTQHKDAYCKGLEAIRIHRTAYQKSQQQQQQSRTVLAAETAFQ